MVADIFVPLLSGLFGGVIVALLNYALNRRKTEAEITKLEAETEKIRKETASMGASVEGVKSDQEQQESTIKDIQRFLVRHLLSEHERAHLERLAADEPWPFQQDGTTQFFVNELRNLRSLGLIEGHPNKGIRSLLSEGGNIQTHFKIRPAGEEYLELLKNSDLLVQDE